MVDQGLFTQIQHLLRRIGDFEQRGGGPVHTGVRGLRGQGHGHHQRIGVDVVQLAPGGGFGGLKPGKDLADRVVIELLCHARLHCTGGGAGARPRTGYFPELRSFNSASMSFSRART